MGTCAGGFHIGSDHTRWPQSQQPKQKFDMSYESTVCVCVCLCSLQFALAHMRPPYGERARTHHTILAHKRCDTVASEQSLSLSLTQPFRQTGRRQAAPFARV